MPRHSVCCSTVKSYQLSQMDCAQLKSIVSLVDYLVRDTHVRKSRMLPSNQVPARALSLAPVSSKSLTDFSICSILGLEHEISRSPQSSGELRILASDTPRGLSRGHHLAFLIIRNQFSSRCLSTISIDLGVNRKRANSASDRRFLLLKLPIRAERYYETTYLSNPKIVRRNKH